MPEPRSVLHCNETTPLAALGIRTTEWQKIKFEPYGAEPVAPYVRLKGVVSSDVASFTPHFWVEFSNDGSTIIASTPSVAIIGAIPIFVDVQCFGQFVRANYQNGITLQGTFEMRLYLEEAQR